MRVDATTFARTRQVVATCGLYILWLEVGNSPLSASSCRDGLDKPPPQPKKGSTTQANGGKATATSKTSKPCTTTKGKDKGKDNDQGWRKPKPSTSTSTKKPTSARSDHDLKQLEALHERTGVTSNLNLTKGKRIKLHESFDDHVDPPSSALSPIASAPASHPRSRRPRPPRPSFDLEFSNLADKDTDNRGRNLADISDADDDDLPDARELIQSATQKRPINSSGANKESSPSTNYDDIEIDALIAETNFDDVLDLTMFPSSPRRETSVTLESSPPQKKRKLAVDAPDTSSRTKRVKMLHPPVAAISSLPPPRKQHSAKVRFTDTLVCALTGLIHTYCMIASICARDLRGRQ